MVNFVGIYQNIGGYKMINTNDLVEVEGFKRPKNSKGMWWLNYEFALEIRTMSETKKTEDGKWVVTDNEYDMWFILRLIDNGTCWKDIVGFDNAETCSEWIKLQFWQ